MKNLIAVILFLPVIFSCSNQSKNKPADKAIKTASGKLTDEELLDSVQYYTFQYFWDGAEPNSGLARERFHVDGVYPQNDKNIVTSGGGGFGVMAILVGIHRGFITRGQGLER